MQPAPTAPRLSVVVSVTHPWPAGRPCFDRLLAQLGPDDELVVADGSGAPLPDEPLPVNVTVHTIYGAGPFTLRRLGVEAARGDIVAITEDHCVVDRDWCDRILGAHTENASAQAIAGSVSNGTHDRLTDRAIFFLTHAANLPGNSSRPVSWLPSAANISFKRSALERGRPIGWLELIRTPELVQSGTVIVDESVHVRHEHSANLFQAMADYFHAGRASSGLHADCMAITRAQRRRSALAAARLPAELLRSMGRSAAQRPQLRRAMWRSLPAALPLAIAGGAGYALGFLRGVGSSEAKVH